jgi:3-oxoacyl-[acyl-carrier protein] reductase
MRSEMTNQTEAATHPDVAGKVALVTGGSGGIGAATCRALAANGARVAVNGRRLEPVDTVVDGVASAATFVAPDASSWITGIILEVAGGQIMR